MFFFQNLTTELFLLESPDDSYFPKSGGSTFLKTVGSHFSEICGNKITAYSEASVHAIDKQEYQPGDVSCARDKHPDGKQDDERNPDTPDIPGKALSLATLTEVEERKHQHRKHHHGQKRRLDEFQFPVHQCERHKYREGISRRYSINTVHKVVDIRRPGYCFKKCV